LTRELQGRRHRTRRVRTIVAVAAVVAGLGMLAGTGAEGELDTRPRVRVV
jgi:hypothetical protein